MDVRFDDHAAFQRAAAWAALGGAALAAVAPLPVAAAGAAIAIAFRPGARRRRLVVASGCAAAAGAALALPAAVWPWALSGAFFALVLASARAEAPASARAVAVALCAAIAVVAAHTLPAAALALSQALPRALADVAAGGALGLWLSLAAAPLHISMGADPVEGRLSALRPSLNAELRALAERAAAARRGATHELPAGARADLRGLLDSLALAALDLASRASELGRAAPASLENDLKARNAALAKNAAAADDERARQSYLRAAEALEGQLEHLRRVRRARERVLARLHEEVANLERARFSLTLLHGGDDAVELDLLHERLQHGAVACESEEDLTVSRPVLT
ncbi:MAG: hypothetical protein E6J78_16360 [Deltaproteobacteria bacterium]|nr:MAG: hypothetical protein E6J78_16360 [Deltaproteobacteria bacterium]